MAKWTFNPFTGTLDKTGNGGSAPGSITISGDTGSPISGSSFSFLGQDADGIDIVDVDTSTGNILISNNSWETQYVVDKSSTPGLKGTFTTIQAAIDKAEADGMTISNPKKIFIRPDENPYIENLNIKAGCIFESDIFSPDNSVSAPPVTILGNHTLSDICSIYSKNINWRNIFGTNLFKSGAVAAIFNFQNSYISQEGDGLIIDGTLGNVFCYFYNCKLYGGSSSTIPSFKSITIYNSLGTFFDNCDFSNTSSIYVQGSCRITNCIGLESVFCGTSGTLDCYYNSFVTGSTHAISADSVTVNLVNNSFASQNPSAYGLTSNNCTIYSKDNFIVNESPLTAIFDPAILDEINPYISESTNILRGIRSFGNYTQNVPLNYIGITDTGTARTVTIKAYEKDYQVFVVDESGNASSNNITVVDDNNASINGNSSYVIDQNFGSALFHWTGTEWIVISQGSSSGSSSGVTLQTNSGNLGPTSLIPLYGIPKGSTNIVSTSIISGSAYIENRTWLSEFVVDPSSVIGSRGTYTTISAAVSAAVTAGASNTSMKTIYLRPGVYAGDYTVPAGIRIVGVSDSDLGFKVSGNGPAVTIQGRLTLTGTSSRSFTSFENVRFNDNESSNPLIQTENVETYFRNCSFEPEESSLAIDLTNSSYSKYIYLENCSFKENSFPRSLISLYETELVAENINFTEGLGWIIHTENSVLRMNDCKNLAGIESDGGRINLSNCNFSPNPISNHNLEGNATGIIKECHFAGVPSGCIASTMLITPVNCSVKGISSGSNHLLFDNAFTYVNPTSNQGNIIQGISTALPYTVPNNVYYIGVNNTSQPGALLFDVVPGTMEYQKGQVFYVKDQSGNASTFNIEISSTTGITFDGASTIYLDTDFECVKLRYNGNGNFYII